MRPVFFMDVQYVDPQSVPLLERAAAEVAGELAIALVHAAGVLQMLVSVVFVGEDLAAPLAFKALCGL